MLEEILLAERESDDTFQKLPSPHFVELSALILEHGRDGIQDSDRVRQLVEGILDARRAKVLQGLANIREPSAVVKLNHLTSSEINVLRPFLLASMEQFYKLAPPDVELDDEDE